MRLKTGFPGFESGSWQGVVAPSGTPKEIVARLNGEILRIVNAADMRDRLGKQGADVRTTTPDEFAAFIRTETAKWAKVVKDANIKIE